jgi:hypothetical protein
VAKIRKGQFKKGQSGNPAGRPKLPPEIKAARQINQLELERILNHVVFLPMPEIKALTKSNEVPAFVVGAAKMVEKFAKYGDIFVYHAILDRMIGRMRDAPPRGELPEPPALDVTPQKKTFTEFCLAAGYPTPYAKQIEMVDFGVGGGINEPRLLLGARNYGKTDYITILGIAYKIYLKGPDYSSMIIPKTKERASALIQEIGKALEANGVELEKFNSQCVRVKGRVGKDHSCAARSIKASMRGPHPDEIIMDDPVTEEDVSQATRDLVQRKYNEILKLTKNVCIIGQPAHAQDLYAKLRSLVKKMEVPWGTIPELDHDLEAQRLAGVDEKSISASYHLKIISDGSMPFERINYLDHFPPADSVAWLDPSHKGRDFSALSIMHQHFQGMAVVGFVAKRAWNHWLDDMVPVLLKYRVKKLCVETNGLGDQPVIMLRQLLKGHGIGVVGMDNTDNKHARIMAAGAYAHLIHLSKESDRGYTDQVIQYEYGAEPDDAPDSLASCLKWLGLIRGKQ